jgi:hypothetical protein
MRSDKQVEKGATGRLLYRSLILDRIAQLNLRIET